jgi:hypothetical protein
MLICLRTAAPIAFLLTVAIGVVSAATLQQEPPAGSLSPGQTVLVDDGSCPAGQIKQIIGGNNAGQPRQRKCVDRTADQTGQTTQDISHDPSQHPAADVALKTPWGEPDLQGIWTDEFDTPFQRPTKYAGQEFFTEAQRVELDKRRAALLVRLAAAFVSIKHTGPRTSRVVDPPNGRIPPWTAEAEKAAAADQQFRLALLQATESCKTNAVQCRGGKYDPTPSPRRAEVPPRYNARNFGRINRNDGPEDGSLLDRCLTTGLPDFGTAFGGGFRRIAQTPGGISIFYDVGEGDAWQRNIVVDGRPHLPPSIRQWYGDSRGYWEGATLIIDVTNFSPKTDFYGSRENLHLIERWTRTGPKTLEYEVTIEDPTTWTRAWTVKQEFTKQSEQENRIYYEPRCIEGNYAFPSMMLAARKADLAFAEGRGPDPATINNLADPTLDDPSFISMMEELIWDP